MAVGGRALSPSSTLTMCVMAAQPLALCMLGVPVYTGRGRDSALPLVLEGGRRCLCVSLEVPARLESGVLAWNPAARWLCAFGGSSEGRVSQIGGFRETSDSFPVPPRRLVCMCPGPGPSLRFVGGALRGSSSLCHPPCSLSAPGTRD